MEMGKRIKELRKAKGLTQEELAQKLGLKDSAIAKYENGRVENIKRSVIIEMAKIFECSPVYLMGLEEPESKPQTLAAHFEGDDFTPEEMEEIMQFAEFVRNRRK